ncbi:MAG: nuclear transport factor 2 family protein [Pseudomarimonas sp.]
MTAASNQALIERFYTAFAALDADTMQASYAPNASFSDPAFSLQGRENIGGMWRMLCSITRAKGMDVWRLESSAISADERRGRAHWEAHYRFSATGRMVHNIIDAQFVFQDGLIVSHIDDFNFYRWSRQALGPPGLVLGWTPFLRNKVRKQAQANLTAFLAKGG